MHRLFLLLALLLFSSSSFSIQTLRGSPSDARSLAERAAEHISGFEGGIDTALSALSAPNTQFVDRDLYVYVIDRRGKLIANGANSKLVGKNMLRLRDLDGQLFVRNALTTAFREQAGWTPGYRFIDPLTGRTVTQQSYVVLVDGMVVGVSVARPPS
ncbi:MAG: cache domain-containing protein [Pseudomonadota bacterium]